MSFFRKAFGLPARAEPEADAARLQEAQPSSRSDLDRIILCIPGPWEDRKAFLQAMVTASPSPEYLPAGVIMYHQPSQTGFEFSVDGHDEEMAGAFAAGFPSQVSEDFIKEIGTHKSVCFLLSMDEEQSPEAARAIALAAAAVVRAGGIGVKVETAGKAFTGTQWLEHAEPDELDHLYWLMVLDSISDGPQTYSCGMRNLGLPDAIVEGEEFQQAAQLLRSFNRYQLNQGPELLEGQTFSTEEGAPRFRLSHEEDQPYDDDEVYTNPFGMWRLSRADTAH